MQRTHKEEKKPSAIVVPQSPPKNEATLNKPLGESGRVKSVDLFETTEKLPLNLVLPRSTNAAPTLDASNPITTKHRQQFSPRAKMKVPARLSTCSDSSIEALDQFAPLSMSSASTQTPSPISMPKFPLVLETQERINAWVVPYKPEDSNLVSIAAYLIKLPPDYYDHAREVSEFFQVPIGVRLGHPELPSNRRNSFSDPETGEVIATAKPSSTKSKTISALTSHGGNTSYLGFGHIARNPLLNQKKKCPLDNNSPGSLPDKIAGQPHDPELTAYLQEHVSPNIKFAYRYYEFVCWEELVPEYAQIGDEYYEKGNLVPKFFIQEAHHIYWLIEIIKRDALKSEDDRYYEFISASTTEMKFNFKGQPFKIRLDILMPPVQLDNTTYQYFNNIEDFEQYVTDIGIKGHHALLFSRSETGFEIPEMVFCGETGHITPDADVQFFGKRFDMPRIAYSIFSADEPNDHIRFIYGLHLLRARITCNTKNEFMDYVSNCTEELKPKLEAYLQSIAQKTTSSMHNYNVADHMHEYLSPQEYKAPDYLNYADINQPERYEYYQHRFLPALDATIAKYLIAPEDLGAVCTSDIYSLIMQVAFMHPFSLHAPEDTNLNAGEVNATLVVNNDDFFVTENEATLLAFIFSDRNLLKNHVISMNPYYLREVKGSDLSHQWLDVILIRCLNAAAISMFEFKMHWQTIVRAFDIDSKYGKPAIEKINLVLSGLEAKLNGHLEDTKRLKFIQGELDSLYEFYNQIVSLYEESLSAPKSWPPGALRPSNRS